MDARCRGVIFGVAVNALSIPPGEYGRKAETQRNWSTVARLKLKEIDGGPHKRWSMWFNSMQREEPYLGLTSGESFRDERVPFGEPRDRCCMAVVSSCREMLG